MRIVQLSDTHLMPGGAPFREIADTSAALARAAETIAGLAERVGPIDLVLVTGDLVEEGDAESYARFRDLTSGISAPIAAIPGNHDDREELRAAFADQPQMPRSGPPGQRARGRRGGVCGCGFVRVGRAPAARASAVAAVCWTSPQANPHQSHVET